MATRRRDLDNMHEMLHSNIKNPQPMANYTLPEFTVEAKGNIPKANIKPVVPIKTTTEPRIEPKNVVNTELGKGMNLEKEAKKGNLQIKPGEILGLEGGTDYYTKGSNVLGEVDLEDGNVIGVNTPKPGRLLRKNKKKKTK
tara:strand:- start:416 stop:838 length:423 start_codon:yes stop_codon:yes gene_type:complete